LLAVVFALPKNTHFISNSSVLVHPKKYFASFEILENIHTSRNSRQVLKGLNTTLTFEFADKSHAR
jgi:hypothetical protein